MTHELTRSLFRIAPFALALAVSACSTGGIHHKVDHADVAELTPKQRRGVSASTREMVEARWQAHDAEQAVAAADQHAAKSLNGAHATPDYEEAYRDYLKAKALEARAKAVAAEAEHEMIKAMVVGRQQGESLSAYDGRLEDFQRQWVDAKDDHSEATSDTSERKVALDQQRGKLARR